MAIQGRILSHPEINESLLVSIVESIDSANSLNELRRVSFFIVSKFDAKNISYGVIGLPPSVNGDRAIIITTYSDQWHRFYFDNNYIDIDPIVRLTASAITPVLWNQIPRSTSTIREFFDNAEHFGVGSQGVTIPLRGKLGESAIFSLTANCAHDHWNRFVESNIKSLQIIASQFHRRVLDLAGPAEQTPLMLSHREATCLRLKALGKTDSDVATILGITKRTVSFHIESARSRLNAVNATHAVAKALALGLISLTSEPNL